MIDIEFVAKFDHLMATLYLGDPSPYAARTCPVARWGRQR